jgi:hypothetical protein
LKALQECIEEQNIIVASMVAGPGEVEVEDSTPIITGEDPMVYESQVQGPDLHVHMSEQDPLNDDICTGYINDQLFTKIL